MADFSTHAILLRKTEYGDHDFIITFLTRSRGKVAVIAKNAKQSVKRFSGALDLFSANHILCSYPKKNKNGMVILAQTGLENGFVNIRYDVAKTAYASYWAELLNLWLEEDKPQEKLYDLLYFSLDMLNRSDIPNAVVSLLFQIRFMSISGFTPNIEYCDTCKAYVDDITQKRVRFDFKEGKIICPRCATSDNRFGMMVSKGTLKQLFWINTRDVDRAERIKFSPFALKEGQALLESFIPFHIGRDLRSLGFLNQMRQEL